MLFISSARNRRAAFAFEDPDGEDAAHNLQAMLLYDASRNRHYVPRRSIDLEAGMGHSGLRHRHGRRRHGHGHSRNHGWTQIDERDETVRCCRAG